MQVLAFAGKEFLHQGHADPLRNAAFDLAFNERGIDRATHVVSCGDFKYLHRAQFDIDLDFSKMRAESEDRVGDALTVLIERAGRRVECSLGGKSVSVSIEGQIGKLDAPMMLSILNSNSAILERNLRALACVRNSQDFTSQLLASHICGFPSHECLP